MKYSLCIVPETLKCCYEPPCSKEVCNTVHIPVSNECILLIL